jgi:type II secretory pathway pseudopilin PulG
MAHDPNTNDRGSGFTVIETMLALAVGAFIIAVLLMAVPALQRSSRNNARRQDVQTILGAVAHYRLSNSGAMPAKGSDFLKDYKLGYYSGDSKDVRYVTGDSPDDKTDKGVNIYSYGTWPAAPATITTDKDLDAVGIYNHEKCDSASGNHKATRRGAGFSDIVAMYSIETGSDISSECQQL